MSDSDAARSAADRMRATAEGFCQAFVAGMCPGEMLDRFFSSDAQITEHGPQWAQARLPFLGTTFRGRRPPRDGNANPPRSGTTCDDYYDVLASTLSFHPSKDTVSPKDFWVAVDRNAEGK